MRQENFGEKMPVKRIVIDLSRSNYYDDVHETIKQALEFPAYYGKNLDALWDCLRDTFVKKLQWEISFVGTNQTNKELQPYITEVLKVFAQAEKAFPYVRIFLTSEQ